MSESVVSCANLSRRYGDVLALKDFSLEAGRGEIYGIIGPDGAGKTTLFRILASLIVPDTGYAKVLGKDVVKDYHFVRRSVGFMPGRFSLYQDLTVEENLRFYASVFGVSIRENYRLIESIYGPLVPFRTRRAGKLSGGMKQKLALACALIHKPELLILDEPTTGVDAVSRKEFWDHLGLLKQEGMTILVATPYMDEAGRCSRLAMLHKGQMLDTGTPDSIIERFGEPLYRITCDDRYRILGLCRDAPRIRSAYAFGQTIHLTFREGLDPDEAERIVRSLDIPFDRFEQVRPSVEDCFMKFLT